MKISGDFLLNEDEIARICAPVKQPAAQCRLLQRLGYTVSKTARGRPLVTRFNALLVLGVPESMLRGDRSTTEIESTGINHAAMAEKLASRKMTGKAKN